MLGVCAQLMEQDLAANKAQIHHKETIHSTLYNHNDLYIFPSVVRSLYTVYLILAYPVF